MWADEGRGDVRWDVSERVMGSTSERKRERAHAMLMWERFPPSCQTIE